MILILFWCFAILFYFMKLIIKISEEMRIVFTEFIHYFAVGFIIFSCIYCYASIYSMVDFIIFLLLNLIYIFISIYEP